MIKETAKELYSQLAPLVRQSNIKTDAINNLAQMDTIFNMLKATGMTSQDPVQFARSSARDITEETNEDMEKQINDALGVSAKAELSQQSILGTQAVTARSTNKIVTFMSPQYDQDTWDWIQSNENLYRELREEYIAKVQKSIHANTYGGYHLNQLTKDIKNYGNQSYSDATRIARTETGKLQGSITSARMNEGGVKTAIWDSTNDNRTRTRHRQYDGIRFDPNKGLPIEPNGGVPYFKRVDGKRVADYSRGGGRIYPGGLSTGGVSAGLVINCRCASRMELTLGNIESMIENEGTGEAPETRVAQATPTVTEPPPAPRTTRASTTAKKEVKRLQTEIESTVNDIHDLQAYQRGFEAESKTLEEQISKNSRYQKRNQFIDEEFQGAIEDWTASSGTIRRVMSGETDISDVNLAMQEVVESLENMMMTQENNKESLDRGLIFSRTQANEQDSINHFMNLEVGETISDNAPSSWSRNEATAEAFAGGYEAEDYDNKKYQSILLHMDEPKVPVGYDIEKFSDIPEEEEVVIPAEQNMTVRKVITDEYGRIHIYLTPEQTRPTDAESSEMVEQNRKLSVERMANEQKLSDARNRKIQLEVQKVEEQDNVATALEEEGEKPTVEQSEEERVSADIEARITEIEAREIYTSRAEIDKTSHRYRDQLVRRYRLQGMTNRQAINKAGREVREFRRSRAISEATQAINSMATEKIRKEEEAIQLKAVPKYTPFDYEAMPDLPIMISKDHEEREKFHLKEGITITSEVKNSKILAKAQRTAKAIQGTVVDTFKDEKGKWKHTAHVSLNTRWEPQYEMELTSTLKIDDSENLFGDLRMNRMINFTEKSAYHEFLALGADLQGHGVTKKLFRSSVDSYLKNDIESIGVHANIDAGGTVWLRYGFVPDSKKSLYEDMRYMVQDSTSHTTTHTSEVHKEVIMDAVDSAFEQLSDGDDTALMKITNGFDKDTKKAYQNIFNGLDWHGKIDLTSETKLKALKEYIGL